MNKVIQKHLAAIVSGKVEKTNVIGLRKAFNTMSRRLAGYSVSSTQTIIEPDDATKIDNAIYQHKPRVIGELHESGLKVLQGKRYRRQLESVSDIVSELDHFTLAYFEEISNGPRVSFFYPVYRAHGKSGKSFLFYIVPWQSGGNGPVIVH